MKPKLNCAPAAARLASLACVATLALVLCGCMPADGRFEPLAFLDLNAASLEMDGPVEYTTDEVNVYEHLVCSDDNITLTAQEDLDASKVGKRTLPVELAKSFFHRTVDVDVQVTDTQAPAIELTSDTAHVQMGEEFDPDTYVSSVKDPVDGALSLVEERPEAQGSEAGFEKFYDQGWYAIEGELNLDEPGTYELEVVAEDQHGNRTTEKLTVEVEDPLEGVKLTALTKIIEYTKDAIDTTRLVVCSDEEASVKADKLTPNKVGEVEVTFTLEKGKATREEKMRFEVQDTQPPTLLLKDSEAVLDVNDKFSLKDYVSSATDPVDGELPYAEKEPKAKGEMAGRELFYDEGWYAASGTVDTTKPGTYKLMVTASDKHGNKAVEPLEVIVKDELDGVKLEPKDKVLEYDNKKTDATKLVTCSMSGAKLAADDLDLSKLGEQTVEYTVTKGSSTKKVKVTFEVRDSKAPQISLKDHRVSVKQYEWYDPYSNVSKVSDPVDGELFRVDGVPESTGDGWYIITGGYDLNAVGAYTLTVEACDRNGNRHSEEFVLQVDAPSSNGGNSSGDNNNNSSVQDNTEEWGTTDYADSGDSFGVISD